MRVAAVAAITLVMPLAVGCGHGQSYCDAVHDHQSELGAIVSSDDRSGLLKALPIFSDLRDKAPDDVAEDWDLVVTRVRALASALTAANVDPTTYDQKDPPAGLSDDDRTAIRRAAAQLAASDTQDALARVQQEVLDVCHTSLEL